MKKTMFIVAILAIALSACKQTEEQKKDKEVSKIIKSMMFCEVKPFKYAEYGYLIERLKNAKEHQVKFGEDSYLFTFDENDGTYALIGTYFYLDIYPESGWARPSTSAFDVCKHWRPDQNKYNE